MNLVHSLLFNFTYISSKCLNIKMHYYILYKCTFNLKKIIFYGTASFILFFC